jgi:hypothetical protein
MTMTNREPKTERNLDGYGAPLIPWTKVRERLEQGMTQAPGSGGPDRHTCWLATVRPDGRPHVMPLGVLWGMAPFTSTLVQPLAKRRTSHAIQTVSSQSPRTTSTWSWKVRQ